MKKPKIKAKGKNNYYTFYTFNVKLRYSTKQVFFSYLIIKPS